MASLVMYLDGSVIKLNHHAVSLGWGFVALANDTHVERHGAVRTGRELSGHHELLALTEAVLYAHQNGYAPHQVAIYTDDGGLTDGVSALSPENYRTAVWHALQARFELLVKRCYDEGALALVLQYLKGARMHKLKSHRNLVYNHRADYLARTSAYSLKEDTPREVQPFEEWLAAGFLRYLNNDETVTWYAPFSQLEPAP